MAHAHGWFMAAFRKFSKKFLKVFGLVVASVALFNGIGVNALLASPLALKVINSKPDFLQVHYSRARTGLPFFVSVEDFELRVQDPMVQLFITARHAEGYIWPWALLVKRFHATSIRANEVRFFLRTRVEVDDVAWGAPATLPPMPGFDSTWRMPGSVIDLSRVITVDLPDLEVHDLAEVWVDHVRATSQADLVGGFVYVPLQRLRIEPTTLRILDARVFMAGEPIATVSNTTLEFKLEQVDVQHFEQASWSALSGAATVNAQIEQLERLNTVLPAGLHVAAGRASLALVGGVDHGVLRDDTVLDLNCEKIAVRLKYFELAGQCVVKASVINDGLTLAVDLNALRVRELNGPALLNGARLRLSGRTTSRDLASAMSADVQLKLERTKATELSFLNHFIPPGAGLRVVRGTGTVALDLAFSTDSTHAHGQVLIDGETLALQNRGATVTGQGALQVKLNDWSLATGAMNLSGSTISLLDVTVQAGKSKSEGFWLKAVADPCLFNPKSDLLWQAGLALESQSFKPMMDIVAANVSVPWALLAISDSGPVVASTTLEVYKESLALQKMRFASGQLSLEGDLKFVDTPQTGGPSVMLPYGNVLIDVRRFELGIEFDGAKSTPVLIAAKAWYRKLPVAQD